MTAVTSRQPVSEGRHGDVRCSNIAMQQCFQCRYRPGHGPTGHNALGSRILAAGISYYVKIFSGHAHNNVNERQLFMKLNNGL